MNPVVFLIIAHRIPPLKDLLRLLDHDFRGIIHIDSRTHIPDGEFAGLRNFHLTSQRLSVYWGGFNMMRVELLLIKEALEKFQDASKFVLISGDSLPAMAPGAMQAALEGDSEYLQIHEVAYNSSEFRMSEEQSRKNYGRVHESRFQNYVYWDSELTNPMERDRVQRMFSVNEATSNYIMGMARRVAGNILKSFGPRPKLFERLYFGQQWWALNRRTVEYVLQRGEDPAVQSYFEFLAVPDEHMVQTIVGNMPQPHSDFASGRMLVHAAHPLSRKQLEPLRLSDLNYSKHLRPFVRKYNPEISMEVKDSIARGEYYDAISRLDG